MLNNPANFIALILAFGVLCNFWLAAREIAIQISLRRNGIVGEASIIRKGRSRLGRNSSPWITYKFFDPNSGRHFQHTAYVGYRNYSQWQVDNAINIIMLGHNPHLSRLADDSLHGLMFFSAGAICLIFPIYFFGWGSLLVSLLFILGVFVINWLWINFRPV